MIKSIVSIKNVGCFKDNSIRTNDEFKIYNIIFGENGAGKTTLSNIISLFSKHFNRNEELINDLISQNSEIHINIDDNDIIYESDKIYNYDIRVFNNNFIVEHVFDGCNPKMKRFNIEGNSSITTPEIKKLEIDLKNKQHCLEQLSKTNDEIEKLYNKYKDSIKNEFNQKLQPRRWNANAMKDLDINTGKVGMLKDIDKQILTKTEEFKTISDEEQMNRINNKLNKFKDLLCPVSIDFNKLIDILSENLIVETNNFVKENIEKFQNVSWFQDGHKLLKSNLLRKCPLCNSEITYNIENILQDYEKCFNSKYNDFDLLPKNWSNTKVSLDDII